MSDVSARVLDGRALARRLNAETAQAIAAESIHPGLAVVLVGDDPASAIYVRNKDRAARRAGIAARTIRLAADTTEATLLALIGELNAADDVDGILVQFPLPRQIRARAAIEAIDPAKDVDGLTPTNAGRLFGGAPFLVPCTPLGIMKLLAEAGTSLAGARAIVLGRSNLVGRPVAALLTAHDATVTIAHSKTRDLVHECRRAEIVIAAAGRPELVRQSWIAPGATVIDVGINRREDGTLVGDVAFAEAATVAGAITPVPGGVGPMTIACLLANVVEAAQARRAAKR